MADKPTYEELEQRIKELEQKAAEREQAEKAIRKSEKYLKTLLANIQAAVVVHGPDTEIVHCNKEAQELLGMTEDQMLDKKAIDPVWNFMREDGSSMSLEEYPVNRVLNERQPLKDFIIGIVRPDKPDLIWILVNANPIFDDNDNVFQVIVTFMDITDRKLAEGALRESEERFRNVYETAPLAFVIWDINTRVTDWNKKAEALFGWTMEEVIGNNFFDFLIPEKDRPQVEDVVDNLIKGELQSYSINDNLTKDGEILTCEWNNSPLHDNDGNIIGAISLGLDITDRKKAEEEKNELQA